MIKRFNGHFILNLVTNRFLQNLSLMSLSKKEVLFRGLVYLRVTHTIDVHFATINIAVRGILWDWICSQIFYGNVRTFATYIHPYALKTFD